MKLSEPRVAGEAILAPGCTSRAREESIKRRNACRERERERENKMFFLGPMSFCWRCGQGASRSCSPSATQRWAGGRSRAAFAPSESAAAIGGPGASRPFPLSRSRWSTVDGTCAAAVPRGSSATGRHIRASEPRRPSSIDKRGGAWSSVESTVWKWWRERRGKRRLWSNWSSSRFKLRYVR